MSSTSTTLSDFASTHRECEAVGTDHGGDLGVVQDDVAGEHLLCERHQESFRRVRDGFDELTEGDR